MTSIAPWALKDPVTNDQAERIISAVARRSLSPAAEAWLRGEDPATNAPVLGEHGHPRMDTSDQVWFANDQLAVRFIEEIDFDHVAEDAEN